MPHQLKCWPVIVFRRNSFELYLEGYGLLSDQLQLYKGPLKLSQKVSFQ